MKNLLAAIVMVIFTGQLSAQEYKVAKSTGKLDIKDVNNVTIEGTTGNEIIFNSRNGKREDDDRARGLKAISASGLEDNTGFGLSVVDKGDVIEVRQLKKMDGPDVIILVPKGVSISISHNSPHGSDITFKNVEGEIEASTVHSGIYLDNPLGPLTINTVHGEIEAKLPATFKSPISLVSVHGPVDVALPSGTKANLRMGTVYGEIFVDPDFKIQVEPKNGMVRYSDKVEGKINGGGLDITLTTTHSNIYLRKK
jgi:predicted membrane protein